MFIDNIIQPEDTREELLLLKERCSQFIQDAAGLPLLKNLPAEYGDFQKVKLRKRRLRKEDTQEISNAFNEAFEDEQRGIRERAVFANGPESFDRYNDEHDEFYIFPIDGFQYMYSTEVENSSSDYKDVFDVIFEEFGSERGNEVIVELLKFTYRTDNLSEGISQGSEIIIYNIPYFYAIRTSSVTNYENLLSAIENLN